jgi:MFS family permease
MKMRVGLLRSAASARSPTALFVSFFLLDRVGRKPVQTIGMLMSAVMLAIFAAFHNALTAAPVLGLIVYGLYNVFITFPSMVSGAAILGVELTPTRIRAVAQSISVVGGRIGASISAFLFPVLFGRIGEIGTIGLLAACAILGGHTNDGHEPGNARALVRSHQQGGPRRRAGIERHATAGAGVDE